MAGGGGVQESLLAIAVCTIKPVSKSSFVFKSLLINGRGIASLLAIAVCAISLLASAVCLLELVSQSRECSKACWPLQSV